MTTLGGAAATVSENDMTLLKDVADGNMEVLVPSAGLVYSVSVTAEGSGVPEFAAPAAPGVLEMDGVDLLDPGWAEVRVCAGVAVATITELLDHADTSTLVPIAVAKDGALLVKACVNGVRRAVPVIPEMAAEVNSSVVASRVAENEVLPLDTANADVEGLVPSVVLVKAVSATMEGSEVSVFATPAGLDADGDELLDSAGAVMLVATGAVVARIPVAIGRAGACERVPTVVADANDDASLLKTFANGVGETVPVILELLEHDNIRVVAARVEGSDVLQLEDPAGAGVRAGTGVVVAMIPVLLDHVAASTLVPIAVAKDDASLLKTCVNGTGGAVPVILEMAAYVNTSGVDSLVAENEVLLL